MSQVSSLGSWVSHLPYGVPSEFLHRSAGSGWRLFSFLFFFFPPKRGGKQGSGMARARPVVNGERPTSSRSVASVFLSVCRTVHYTHAVPWLHGGTRGLDEVRRQQPGVRGPVRRLGGRCNVACEKTSFHMLFLSPLAVGRTYIVKVVNYISRLSCLDTVLGIVGSGVKAEGATAAPRLPPHPGRGANSQSISGGNNDRVSLSLSLEPSCQQDVSRCRSNLQEATAFGHRPLLPSSICRPPSPTCTFPNFHSCFFFLPFPCSGPARIPP